jgi:tRNA(Ile)-lysidine synthase
MSPVEDPWNVLENAVLQAGIPPDARILVAVSGGPDSVALLETLHRLAHGPEHRWSLRIGHVNHGLRADESEEDERFVRSLAAERDLAVDAVQVDTILFAQRQRVSIEVAARELRSRALREMLEAWPGELIATGHTQDDQAGTILLRLIRGTGLAGLAGMQPRIGSVIRPFLAVRHDLILRALTHSGQPHRIDSSNFDTRHRRNQIQQEVMPALARIQPRTIEILGRTANLLRSDYDYLSREAEAALSCLNVKQDGDEVSAALAVWRSLHPSLRRLCLRLLIERLLGETTDVHESHLAVLGETLDRANASSLLGQLPRGLAIYVDDSRFSLRKGPRPTVVPFACATLEVPGSVPLEVGTLAARLLDDHDHVAVQRMITVCGALHAICDADHVDATLTVRPRRPGDRIRPLGAPGTRKLQDIMVDRHIPPAARELIPVVESSGGIVWVPGLALERLVSVTPETTRFLHLTFEPGDWRGVIECLSRSYF